MSKKTFIPTRYQGLPSDIVEKLWVDPIYIDNKKNVEASNMRELALKEMRRGEENTRRNTEKVIFKEIYDIYNEVCSERKATLYDDLFLVGHGTYPDNTDKRFNLISGKIGQHFDAHGIAKTYQLTHLISLLTTGIDKSKPFHTAPFEVLDEERGTGFTPNSTAYKDGLAIITSGYNQSLFVSGIKHVFINDVFGRLVKPLTKVFSQYNFHLLSEQKKILTDEYNKQKT